MRSSLDAEDWATLEADTLPVARFARQLYGTLAARRLNHLPRLLLLVEDLCSRAAVGELAPSDALLDATQQLIAWIGENSDVVDCSDEAAAALGLPRRRQTFRIVLPQAMRTILPTAFNDIIGMAKGTSNVYIVAIPELFYTVQVIFHRNLEVIPLLMVATVWYLIILTVLSAIQFQVERHFARGALRTPPPALLARWKHAETSTAVEAAPPAARSWARMAC